MSNRPQNRLHSDLRGPVQHEWESVGTTLSTEESTELAADFRGGMIVADLSRKYGVHRSTVHKHLHKHGLRSPRNSLDDARVLRARKLYKAGHTLLEVAKLIGSNDRTVREAFVAHGIPRRAPFESGNRKAEPS